MRSWCSSVAICSGLPVAAVVAVLIAASSCVPAGNAPPYDAGAPAPAATAVQPKRPAVVSPPLTTVFEDNFDRVPGPGAGGDAAVASAASSEGGARAAASGSGSASASAIASGVPASAAATRLAETTDLGPDWIVVGGALNTSWRIEQGKLCGRNAKNRGVWLNRTLPVNARIEFDAISDSPEGDLKAEVWGDGQSGATAISYTNATSYLVVFGGWKNTLHVLARLNEHGSDRKFIEVKPSTDEFRERAVAHGQAYRFKIERSDGKTVRWWVNDVEMLDFADPEPLVGATHDHFGFNDWQIRVCFDNVKVTPLSSL